MSPAHERGAARTLCCNLFGEQIGPAFQPGPDRAASIRFPIMRPAAKLSRDPRFDLILSARCAR